MNLLYLLGFVTFISSTLPTEASEKYQYIVEEDEINSIPGEFFPYCVEVSKVWPPPHSILKPAFIKSRQSKPQHLHYLFRVAFSRPVSISNNDTSGGWQPELAHLPVKYGWLQPKDGSVAKAIKFGKFNLEKVAPIFLSPSQTLTESRYYAHRITSWHGSSKEFLVYFTVPAESKGPNLTLSKKVYLVIDGGRFYSMGKVRSARHAFFVQTTIIGEYYFEEYLKRNRQFKPSLPVLFKPSSYCEQRKPRAILPGGEDNVEQLSNFTAWLKDGSHTVFTSNEQLSVNLTLSVRGAGEKLTLRLPSATKGVCGGVNVSVALPESITITVKQSLIAPKVYVPVKRVPIYELREQIYHNGIKLMMPGSPPAFVYTSFTENEKDRADGLFPEKILKESNHVIDLEMIEMSTGVRLSQHYPYWEWFPNNKLTLQKLLRLQWLEVSRTAPIAARSDRTRYRGHGAIIRLQTNYKFLANNSHLCPVNSSRNVAGRCGATLDHVVEYGPLYHLLEPLHPSSWSVESKVIDLTAYDDKGTKVPVSVRSPYNGVDSSIPSNIFEGIQKYRCLLPPIKDIPKPTHSHTVNEKWVHLDKCIFVPTAIAESQQCGGLKLFQNVQAVFSSSEFCNQSFGDCIGLPFSSSKRFPVIRTFGLHELTGWIPCLSTQCPLNSHQQHPMGVHSIDGRKNNAVPKSILKFRKTQGTPESSIDDTVMELRPTLNADSRMNYVITISGVKILDFLLSAQPIQEGDSHAPPSLSSSDCDTVWHFVTTPLKVRPQLRDASLTATLYNHGQGGRDILFDVECTEQLTVYPESGVITVWIEPMSSVSVTFLLSGDLASSAPSKNHKCMLTIRPNGSDESALECSKWFTTYYGTFENPCHWKAEIPEMIDLAYYVLPPSQYESSHLEHFLDSPIGSVLQFVRAITVSLLIPQEQQEVLMVLNKMTVSCHSGDVVPLLDSQILQEAVRSVTNGTYNMGHKVTIHEDFTEPRKVYFFATRSWVESQSTPSPLTSSCELTLTVFRPNWVCRKSSEVVRRLHVPLVKPDIEAINNGGTFSMLYPLFGRQSDLVMMSLCLSAGFGAVSFLIILLGCGVLCINRSRLPRKRTLDRLKDDLDKAKEEDKRYWENPAMYLCSGDGCDHYGETHHGPHFILHQWRGTEPLDTRDIKHLKIAGVLKYKIHELPVMFGHIKKMFMHKTKDIANVWVQASSGMYLLPSSTVSPDYLLTFVEFCQSQGLEESCYVNLLTKADKMDADPQTEKTGSKEELGVAGEYGEKEETKDTQRIVDEPGSDDVDFGDEHEPLL